MRTSVHSTMESVEPTVRQEIDVVLNNDHCKRCGGLLVNEHCTDLLDNTGRMDFPALRCVQCGEVVDVVILLNRLRAVATKSASQRPTKWDTHYGGTDRVH